MTNVIQEMKFTYQIVETMQYVSTKIRPMTVFAVRDLSGLTPVVSVSTYANVLILAHTRSQFKSFPV